MSCQTCYTELSPFSLKAREAFITPCCESPICYNCINKNPRLKDYIPCLKCGDPRTADLRGGGGGGSKMNGMGDRENNERSVIGGEGQEVLFEIGDEDEDEDEPPRYDDLSIKEGEDGYKNDGLGEEGDSTNESHESVSSKNAEVVEEEQYETVEIKHKIQRGDTVLSIARKYAADPHDLLSLNNLPYTALSTNQRIIQTRRTLIISRRKILSSKLSSTPLPHHSQEEEINEEREKQKQLKRFQLLTKNPDLGIANTYLNLSELEESLDPIIKSSGETVDGKKSIVNRDNREQRALESFFDDTLWENDNGIIKNKLGGKKDGNGRWNVVGNGSGSGSGSGIKI